MSRSPRRQSRSRDRDREPRGQRRPASGERPARRRSREAPAQSSPAPKIFAALAGALAVGLLVVLLTSGGGDDDGGRTVADTPKKTRRTPKTNRPSDRDPVRPDDPVGSGSPEGPGSSDETPDDPPDDPDTPDDPDDPDDPGDGSGPEPAWMAAFKQVETSVTGALASGHPERAVVHHVGWQLADDDRHADEAWRKAERALAARIDARLVTVARDQLAKGEAHLDAGQHDQALALADQLRASGHPRLATVGRQLLDRLRRDGKVELPTGDEYAVARFERLRERPLSWGGRIEGVDVANQYTPRALRWTVPADRPGQLLFADVPGGGGFKAVRLRLRRVSGNVDLEVRLLYDNGAMRTGSVTAYEDWQEMLVNIDMLEWVGPRRGTALSGLLLIGTTAGAATVELDDVEFSRVLRSRRSFDEARKEFTVWGDTATGLRAVDRAGGELSQEDSIRLHEPYQLSWTTGNTQSWVSFDRLPESLDAYRSLRFRMASTAPVTMQLFLDDGTRLATHRLTGLPSRMSPVEIDLSWMESRSSKTRKRRLMLLLERPNGATLTFGRIYFHTEAARPKLGAPYHRRVIVRFDEGRGAPKPNRGSCRIVADPKATGGKVLSWKLRAADRTKDYDADYLFMSVLPKDMRGYKTLRIRLRRPEPQWRAFFAYVYSGKAYSGYRIVASALDKQWREIEVPLERLRPYKGGFDPAKATSLNLDMKFPTSGAYEVQVDRIELDIDPPSTRVKTYPVLGRSAMQVSSLDVKPTNSKLERASGVKWTLPGYKYAGVVYFDDNTPQDLSVYRAMRVKLRKLKEGCGSISLKVVAKGGSAKFKLRSAKVGKWVRGEVPFEQFEGIGKLDLSQATSIGVVASGPDVGKPATQIQIAKLSLLARPVAARKVLKAPVIDTAKAVLILDSGKTFVGKHEKVGDKGVRVEGHRTYYGWEDIAWFSWRDDPKEAIEAFARSVEKSKYSGRWMALVKTLMFNRYPRARIARALEGWRVRRGEPWKVQMTRHFVVCGNVERQRLTKYAGILEAALAAHRRIIPSKAKKPGLDFVVRVYRSTALYEYETKSGGIGVFDSWRRELGIRDNVGLKSTGYTLFHEVNHQYLQQYYLGYRPSDAVPWYSEGIADYFGTGKFSGGSVGSIGEVDRSHQTTITDDLKRGDRVQKWLRFVLGVRGYGKWKEGGTDAYCYSWLAVHFFFNTRNPAYRKAWKTFLVEQPGIGEAKLKALYGRTIGALDRAQLVEDITAHARRIAGG